MAHRRAGHHVEQLGGDVLTRAISGRGNIHPVRVGLGVGDEFRNRPGRTSRIDDEEIAVATLPIEEHGLSSTPWRRDQLIAVLPQTDGDMPRYLTPAFIAGRALILDGRSQIDPPARSVARQGLVAVMLRAKDRPLARCVLRSVRHEREIVSKYGRI